jgi:hypothetical protein
MDFGNGAIYWHFGHVGRDVGSFSEHDGQVVNDEVCRREKGIAYVGG